MKKEKWDSMSDDEKTIFMRGVFKSWHFGDDFDYARCREVYERISENNVGAALGVFDNPCIVLSLVDPMMAAQLMSWLYSAFDMNGKAVADYEGETAPLFGYNIDVLYFDKSSLAGFDDEEKRVLTEAVRIISNRANIKND